MVPWIVASMALDRLPFWVALPLGLGGGVALGSWIAGSDTGALGWLVAALVLGVIAILGFTAPRAVNGDSLSPVPQVSGATRASQPSQPSESEQDEPPGDELLI